MLKTMDTKTYAATCAVTFDDQGKCRDEEKDQAGDLFKESSFKEGW